MQRGRKSAYSLGVSVVSVPGGTTAPPEELSPDEAVEWCKLVGSQPPDWFPTETHPLLVQLCRHICQSRFVGETLQEVRTGLLNLTDEEDVKKLDALSRLFAREGRAIVELMAKLRLTPQALIQPKLAAALQDEVSEVKPWADVPGSMGLATKQ
jgi:hypothetical protein